MHCWKPGDCFGLDEQLSHLNLCSCIPVCLLREEVRKGERLRKGREERGNMAKMFQCPTEGQQVGSYVSVFI